MLWAYLSVAAESGTCRLCSSAIETMKSPDDVPLNLFHKSRDHYKLVFALTCMMPMKIILTWNSFVEPRRLHLKPVFFSKTRY